MHHKCHEREGDRCLDQHHGQMPEWPISCQYERAAATVEDDQATEESGLGKYDEVVTAKNMQRLWMPFLLMLYPWRQRRLTWGSTLMHHDPSTMSWRWLSTYRVSLCKMHTPSWRKVARMQSWWWGIVWPNPKLSRRKPQWPEQWPQLWCQNCTGWDQVARGGRWASRPSHT